MRSFILSIYLLFIAAPLFAAGPGNRLTYLDEPCDPYYVGRDFPKLATPMWVGEEGVEAVVVLAIDDMRDPAKYEAYLRPILERLKEIDGRAPLSIMTNAVDPADPRLQAWLREGLSIEIHTADHPCPCLQNGDFKQAKSTYDRCVDQMSQIPGNKPVAFRMPCCDSLNTPSPRFWTEIFNRTTEGGNYLAIDSSVFQILTPDDTSLPAELTRDESGGERFRRYIPFPSFVNTIENYPYPYVIGGLCWQFPCMVPSDWEAQHVQQPNNPLTVADMKRALDATVLKQGVFNLVFHPHGWIRSEQVVELLDHAVTKHGRRVKFLNFREALERINEHLLAGQPLRDARGGDNGVRLLDVDNDGWQDVVIGNESVRKTRVWKSEEKQFVETAFPWPVKSTRFGVLAESGAASAIGEEGVAHFRDGAWRLEEKADVAFGSVLIEGDVRLRDFDGDGVCELLLSSDKSTSIHRYDAERNAWQLLPFALPQGASLVDEQGRDAGLRFTDIDGDDRDDLLFSNDDGFGAYLFDSLETGFSKRLAAGDRKSAAAFPAIVRNGTNNGAWIHSKHLWVQNEDTARLADGVDRLSFASLLNKQKEREARETQPTIPVGAASVDITPNHPIRLTGYGSRTSETAEVAQRIFAKAIAIGDDAGAGPAVVVSFENCNVPANLRKALAERLLEKAKVRPERLLLCCTHSHSAPLLADITPYLFSSPPPPEHVANVEKYTATLFDKLTEAALAALANRRPARLSWAPGEAGFAANRRLLANGKWVNFGVQADGPVDRRLSVLRALDEDDKPIAIWMNYACHNTTIGGDFNKIAGDWAGFAQEYLEAAYPGAVALISIGCGADANPEPRGNFDLCKTHGREVADEVARLFADAAAFQPLTHALDCRLSSVDLPLENSRTIEEWRELAKAGNQTGAHARHFLAKLERGEELPNTVREPVAVWNFGHDLAMVFLGGEVVVDYALRMYDEYDAGRLWITAYANDTPGYIPSQRLLREGGYETDFSQIIYGHPNRYAPQIEDMLIDTVQRLLPREFYGEKKQAEFPPAKSPEESLAAIRVRPGFKVELVASEPLIADPVAFDWAPDGRLFVAEMADYPLGIDPPNEVGAVGKPGGRVKLLTDDDRDGKYDRASLFLDGVPYPTGVMSWRDGAIVVAAPNILFAADRDGDGRAEVQEVLYEGFREGNQQHRANGPRYGLDHWLYLANGDSDGEIQSKKTGEVVSIRGRDLRIAPDSGGIQTESGRTQFGRNRDDWGNWFGGNNSEPLWHYVLEERYLKRNPRYSPGDVRVLVPAAPGAAPVFAASKTLSRFNDIDRQNRFTSACSHMIYRDDLFGEGFIGNSFVCEPVHNLVHREIVSPQGVTFTSRRASDEQASEFFASSDNWCRPVMCRTGPDGALWIADMYRAVIEHPEWIPVDWQRRLDLRAGEDRGRIYRVFPEKAPPRQFENLAAKSPVDLVESLDSPSGWRRDTAQQLLLWRGEKDVAPALRKLAIDCPRAEARLHALYTLAALDALDDDLLIEALADSHSGIRRHALKLAESRFDKSPAVAQAVKDLSDDDSQVVLQLACSLGEWSDPAAGEQLAAIARQHAGDRFILAAVMSSIGEGNAETFVAGVVAADSPPELIAQVVEMAAGFESTAALKAAVASAVGGAEDSPAAWRLAAVAGALEGLASREEASKEIVPEAFVSQARAVALDAEAPGSSRQAAIGILGRSAAEANRDALLSVLAPQTPVDVQQAAVAALSASQDERSIESLLERWSGLTPNVRSQVFEELLAREEATKQLIEAVEGGRLSANQFDARRRQQLRDHPSSAIRERAKALFSGASDPSRKQVLESYAKVSELAADAGRGKAVFEKRCANCHKLGGAGHEVGPDLAALTDKSLPSLLTAVLDPNRAVEDKFLDFTATTADGRVVNGLLWSESGAGVTLRAAEGKEIALPRAEIEELKSTGKSLMPEGLERDVTQQEMADVLAFVRKLEPPAKKIAGNDPKVVTADSDGALHLPATACRIYGPTLVFEQLYGNLGYWQSESDRAAWTAEVPREGVYRVSLIYACENGSAGGELVVEANGQQLGLKIRGTGTWDDYQRIEIGEVRLPMGAIEISAKSVGQPSSALLDLREVLLSPLKSQ